MLGLSYISVPLYQIFCQTYGLGGTIQKSNVELNKIDNVIISAITTPTSTSSLLEARTADLIPPHQTAQGIESNVSNKMILENTQIPARGISGAAEQPPVQQEHHFLT